MSATRSRRYALQLAASALIASLGLAACGGGTDSTSSTDYSVYGWTSVTALKIVENIVGTGTSATTGTTATVTYTGYLYDVRVSDTKGTKFDAGTYSFKLGAGTVISGFDTGVNGMKVGGSRTVTIPASLAYGSTGSGSVIPANAALVFDIALTAVN
jgi:FKBP-type peptidyl-prolyl cis-trans isomerase FkpA